MFKIVRSFRITRLSFTGLVILAALVFLSILGQSMRPDIRFAAMLGLTACIAVFVAVALSMIFETMEDLHDSN